MNRLHRLGRRIGDGAGFTLIEALVSLAIGGFVIATLATVTGQWLRNWRFAVPVLQRSEMLAAGLDHIAADLAAAQFMPASPEGGTSGVFFMGEPTSVTFVRRLLPVEGTGGLEVVRLAPPMGGEITLTRSRSPLRFGATLTAPADTAPLALLRAPYAVQFAYADAGQAWQVHWTTSARIPRFIRVEVVDRRTGREVLASEVVAVRVTASPACAGVRTAFFCDTAMGIAPPGASASRGNKLTGTAPEGALPL